MFLQMIFMFAACLALLLIGVGLQFDVPHFLLYVLGVLVVSPFLAMAIVSAIAWVADWSDRRARAGRIAKAKARKSSVSSAN